VSIDAGESTESGLSGLGGEGGLSGLGGEGGLSGLGAEAGETADGGESTESCFTDRALDAGAVADRRWPAAAGSGESSEAGEATDAGLSGVAGLGAEAGLVGEAALGGVGESTESSAAVVSAPTGSDNGWTSSRLIGAGSVVGPATAAVSPKAPAARAAVAEAAVTVFQRERWRIVVHSLSGDVTRTFPRRPEPSLGPG
jgi:hypothetical protein